MKTRLGSILLALLALSSLNLQLSTAFAQGTAFTFQGRLNSGGSPANGSYDLRFILYDNSVGGNQQGPILTNSATAVSNGLFTVTLDFGSVFPGAVRWLDIAVRTNGNSAFTELDTRQLLTATPYAITAGNVTSGGLAAGTYGSAVTFSNAANSFSGNGAGLQNVNAVTLGGLAPSGFWQLGGDTVSAGQFVGSVNNQPLDFRVNNLRVMEFAYVSNSASGYSPNVVGGNGGNNVSAGVVGATIGGGGMTPGFLTGPNTVTADFGTVVGGATCSASGKYAIAGGSISAASGQFSVALGGFSQASGDYSVAMGTSMANGTYSTAFGNSKATNSYAFAAGQSVAGSTNSAAFGYSQATNGYAFAAGYQSVAGGFASTAMGASTATGIASTALGAGSYAFGDYSTALGGGVASGYGSTAIGSSAEGMNSFAAGNNADAANDNCFVWSDGDIEFGVPFLSTAPNQFLIHATGGVGIGTDTPAASLHVETATTNTPQVQITQDNSSDSVRFRMNSGNNLGWEMDVSSGSAPQLQFWYIGAAGPRMTIDTSGNVTTTGTVNGTSDRNAKENFSPVDSREVLDKVAALPITRWNYKTDTKTPHVGPMAQDFHAAFNVGMDDKHIATVDEEGVALAAIQGLNQKLNEKDVEIQQLKESVAQLRELVSQLAKRQAK